MQAGRNNLGGFDRALQTRIAITVVCNIVIITPAGHGIAFLGLIEYATLVKRAYEFTYVLRNYESALGTAAMFSLMGQVIMLGSLLIPWKLKAAKGVLLGMLWALLGFVVLTGRAVAGDTPSIISLVTGIPFLIASIGLIGKLLKEPVDEEND